ncbi:MAG: PVC-type heme-binding CxxCH protein [Pirellulales bacterium]
MLGGLLRGVGTHVWWLVAVSWVLSSPCGWVGVAVAAEPAAADVQQDDDQQDDDQPTEEDARKEEARRKLEEAEKAAGFLDLKILERGKHYNLTPEEARAAITVPEGFRVTLSACEPDLRQPNAFCVDDRGRVWVGENYTYTKYGWEPDQRDRILIFSDRDGDGVFDERKVFSEDITYVSGLEVGHGGVWVGSPPNLMFIPDRNHDDVPDSAPEVVLDGWGAEDQHETLNSFCWGPDGWLYGCHGVFVNSKVGAPGTPEDQRTPLNAGVWRYHPVRKEFEVFAWGTSNPWGIDWDDHGQLLMTACVIPHLWHVVQGGRYHRQAGQHFDPFVYDDIKTIAKHNHQGFKGREGGFAHGGALLYQGTTFPPQYRGKLFMFNIHHRCIYIDQLERAGSGFTGDHFEEFLFANDPWFIGFSLQQAPNGSMYFIDWYDQQICHGQTPAGKSTGRLYRISYGDTKELPVDLAASSSEELAKLQASDNEWQVRHARRLLAERAVAGDKLGDAHAVLHQQLQSGDTSGLRLRALWALHTSGGITTDQLRSLLDDPDEYLRSWAIQLLTEQRQAEPEVVAKLAELSRSDPSQVVRLYLASAMQRLPVADRWSIAEGLVGHAEDVHDHNLELMYWYAIEPLVAADGRRALTLASRCALPEGEKTRPLRTYIARRLAQR